MSSDHYHTHKDVLCWDCYNLIKYIYENAIVWGQEGRRTKAPSSAGGMNENRHRSQTSYPLISNSIVGSSDKEKLLQLIN